MQDDHLRVPVEESYVTAIGKATYCFARLEWDAVYCGEKLKPGYLRTVRRKTAGTIASNIAKFAPLIGDASVRARFEKATDEFKRLVQRRNGLLHARPATVAKNQRLVRDGATWEPSEIYALADECAACSGELNDLYYSAL